MLSSAFLSVAVFIATAIAIPTLLLELSGPPCVNSIDELIMTTTVKNRGDEAVKLLNHPYGPLSDLPTDIFTVTNRYGDKPQFIGIGVKYSPSAALASKDPCAYTELAPGQSISSDHNISNMYDFLSPGTGQYVVRMKSTMMLYGVVDGKVSMVAGDWSDPFHMVTISGSVRSHQSRSHEQPDKQCGDEEKRAISASIDPAKDYVDSAIEEMKNRGPSGAHYKSWFGPASGQYDNRFSTVSGHFEALAKTDFTEYTYTCHARFCAKHPGLFGYVYTDEFGTINLCKQFFEAGIKGPDSRASTIVHEALLFTRNGGVVGHIQPHFAAMNADNHEYFAVNAADHWPSECVSSSSGLSTSSECK